MGQVYGSVLLLPFAIWRFLDVGFNLKTGVITALFVSTIIIIGSTYLYIEALRITDISITEPIRNISPIFVALLEPLIMDINYETMLLGAAFLGSAGAYILVAKDSLITPIENMKNKGALISVIVAFILAIYSIAQRFGATNADPLLFTYLCYLTSLAGFWYWKRKESEQIEIKSYFRKDIFALGTVTALGVVAGIFAYSMISASEVTVIKQSSAVFSVLIGGRFFKEEDLVRKLLGAVIIMLGVLAVVL
jgi:drug/metabolite transporter (DMT)-like permease